MLARMPIEFNYEEKGGPLSEVEISAVYALDGARTFLVTRELSKYVNVN